MQISHSDVFLDPFDGAIASDNASTNSAVDVALNEFVDLIDQAIHRSDCPSELNNVAKDSSADRSR